MRYWIASFALCLCALNGYSQEPSDSPAEVTIADEGDSDEIVSVDSKKQEKPDSSGCGCGNKPKI